MSDTDDPVKLFGLQIAHIGINAKDEKDAEQIVSQFQTLMGLQREVVAPVSIFAGTLVEVMKGGGRGERGHIGFHVDDIQAAEKWFSARGFELDEQSRKKNPDGSTFLVYFKQQIAGFAIHLTVAD
ncbi:MAG: VOC family protein [Olegusella sp.]|nr:VOC family protein [Olegusella sp.]